MSDEKPKTPLNKPKPPSTPQKSSSPPSKPQDFAATIVGGEVTQPVKAPGGDKLKKPAPGPAAVPASSKPKPKDDEPLPQFSNYEIVRKLGQGGMGAVYLAKQINLDRMCALKVMMKEIAKNEQFVVRFKREAKAMARIEHPNLVRCYDVGEENGIHYLAMELIDGKSMQDWCDTLRIIPVGDAVHVTLLCAEALKQAHALNMIHRDIKPDNILITKKGEVKVSDLGLAKNTEEDMSMTQSGTGLGTPHYMAPEQARNAKHVDGRSDIYALGCTIYHFVTGKRPFFANSTLELIMEKEKGKYEPAHKINPKVSEKLSLIIDKMMMKNPDHRYKTCDELIKDLDALHLASPSLSFITGDDKVSMRSGVSSAPARNSSPTAKTMPAALTKTSQEDALAKQQQQLASKMWHIKMPMDNGQIQSAKLKTEQILSLIKTGKISLKAQVTDDPKKPYIAISQVPVFDNECRKLHVKVSAESQGQNLKDKFAKLDQQHKWRKFWKFFEDLRRNVIGSISFIALLCALGAVAVGIWTYRADINELVKSSTGFDPGFGKVANPNNNNTPTPPNNTPPNN